MLPILNKAMVFVKYWNDKDEKIKIEKKHKAMAEVLVLDRVPVQFLASVLVGTNGAKESLLQKLPECPVPVIINCGLFFQPFAGTNIPRNL